MKLAQELMQKMNEVAEAQTIKKLAPLGKEELLRGLRLSVSGEYEAVKLYLQIAEATDDAKVKQILESIAKEEQVHVGELLAAIKLVDPQEAEAYEKGKKEALKD